MQGVVQHQLRSKAAARALEIPVLIIDTGATDEPKLCKI